MVKKMKKLIIIVLLSYTSIVNVSAKEENDIVNFYEQNTEFTAGLIYGILRYEKNTAKFKDSDCVDICIDEKVFFSDEYLNLPKIGIDARGDGLDIEDYDDLLLSLLNHLDGDIENNLKEYYGLKGYDIIKTIEKIYNEYPNDDLLVRQFPIPKRHRGDYQNAYGTKRSYKRNRSHEGIDIFAYTSTPVVATSYGVVEKMGWNELGGYRIGIRDLHNTYQYYAHLNSFSKNLKVGDVVKVGEVIGYVGSTGYGKEGTRGKFPPHLHFGLYKYDGKKEWAFNPYHHLRNWEKK